MATLDELSGVYTYRSFLDLPQPVDDFQSLRFAQLELRLTVTGDGDVSGLLRFGTSEPPSGMDISGRVSGKERPRFRLTGRGQPGSGIEDFHYEYDGELLPHWPTGVGQRGTIAGTVLRAEAHGEGAPAGFTASFLAVRRDDPS
jgi:hypothetical protein